MIKQLLALKGIHYLVTRFGSKTLRSWAFDAKYSKKEWCFNRDGSGELEKIIVRYLRKGDLLILGCGGASILDGLESKGLNSALGLDLSEEAIRLASQFSSAKVSFQKADMETFECPINYDIILFSESLNYISASKQIPLLRKLARSIKPNGVLIVTLADAKRYHDILVRIRSNFKIIEDRSFASSARHLLVFG